MNYLKKYNEHNEYKGSLNAWIAIDGEEIPTVYAKRLIK